MPTKRFHLGDLLSVTTGILVSPRHMDGVYDLCDYVTGQAHLTHQLPRASREITPFLLEQHPWLRDITVPEGMLSESEVLAWLATVVSKWGEMHSVRPMGIGQYVGREPISELQEMAPHMQIIPVELPSERSDG